MTDVRILTGAALDAALDDVARLRITVFRAWPYLYDGTLDYERHYLQTYRDSAGAVLVGAFDQGRLVGASTGTPMEDHPEFAQAFAGAGLALTDIFYCAESVLLPDWRGRGIGHQFFDAREDHARALGRSHAAFCAVIRPPDHPARPAAYRPLDPFWHARGYAPLPGALARYSWTDVGEDAASEKQLQVWLRSLR